MIRSRKLEPPSREEFPPCWALPLANNLHSPGNLQGRHPRVYWDQIPHTAILASCQGFPDLPSLYSTTISLISQMADDFLTSSDLSVELLLCAGWPHPDAQRMRQTNTLQATPSLPDFHQPSCPGFFLHSLSLVYRFTTRVVPKPEVWEHVSLSFFLSPQISHILNLTVLAAVSERGY